MQESFDGALLGNFFIFSIGNNFYLECIVSFVLFCIFFYFEISVVKVSKTQTSSIKRIPH